MPTRTPKEQIAYANLLFYGSWSALAIMTVTYLIYVFGIMEPHVPLQDLIQLWRQPVGTYLAKGNVPVGWGWVGLLGSGDFLNFIGIAILAGMTIVCFIPLIPAYLAKKEPIFAAIAAAEVVVLALAASGIFGTGGH